MTIVYYPVEAKKILLKIYKYNYECITVTSKECLMYCPVKCGHTAVEIDNETRKYRIKVLMTQFFTEEELFEEIL